MTQQFELVFSGGSPVSYDRSYDTFEAAREEALTVLAELDDLSAEHPSDSRYSRAAHPAIIYGPGCGRDGTTIA